MIPATAAAILSEALERGPWLDISRPLSPAIAVWPGDHPFELRQQVSPGAVLSSVATTCHVGTHLDAPLHLDPAAEPVEEIALARLMGLAEVVQVASDAGVADRGALAEGWQPRASRILVRTDSQPLTAPIGEGFTALSPDLAHWLADHGVVTVGIDTPSVDRFDSVDLPVHHALAERGLTWLEGLWLGSVAPGLYLLVGLPLALVGAEAAPVRALLSPLGEDTLVEGEARA